MADCKRKLIFQELFLVIVHFICNPVHEKLGQCVDGVVCQSVCKRHRFDEGGNLIGLDAVIDDVAGPFGECGERSDGTEEDHWAVKDLGEHGVIRKKCDDSIYFGPGLN